MADTKISEETILIKDGTERIPAIQSDGTGGWVNGALEVSDLGGDTIYSNDGSLDSDRTVNGTGAFGLAFANMVNLFLLANKQIFLSGNNDGTVTTDAGVLINGTGTNDEDVAFAVSNGFFQAIQMFKTGAVSVPAGFSIGEANSPIDSSLSFDVRENGTKLSRPFAAYTTSEINALVSVLNYAMCIRSETGFPEIYHPVYEWQSLGYGTIRLTIDFSVTPFTGAAMLIPTNIPSGKIIHKMVVTGNSLDTDNSPYNVFIGMESDSTYLSSDDSNLNSISGDVSIGNSQRTLTANENLQFSATESISSGSLDILILHT